MPRILLGYGFGREHTLDDAFEFIKDMKYSPWAAWAAGLSKL